MKNSVKSYRRQPEKPSLVQEMAGTPSQSAKEGGELKKKFVRLRSVKIADRGGIKPPSKQGKGGIYQSGVHVGVQKKSTSERKVKRRSPNYMNPTSSSDRKKEERLQVSTHKQTNDRIQSKPVSHASKKNVKYMKSLSRLSSLKPRKPSMKTSGVPSYLVPDVTRATCSSTLKDSKFPDYVELNPGSTESEGTSVLKVCPYTYCSLNGHCHKPSPPLKRFLSARRRSLKAQKNVKLGEAIGCKIKNVINGKKKTDTALNLVPYLREEVDVISSPRSLDSWDEQLSELLTGDWDDDFFVEIYANSIPDLTDFEEFGVMEHGCSDVPQSTNEKTDTKESTDGLVVACEKVPSGFGQRTETEDHEESYESDSVVDNSCYEPSLVDVEEDGNEQDQSTDSSHEEAINASGGASEQIDSNREEKKPAPVENNSSIQTAMTSEVFTESNSSEDDFVSNNECQTTSSAPEITFGAAPSDKDIISYGLEAPVDSCGEIAFPPAEDPNVFSENLKIGTGAAPSDQTSITKGGDSIIMEFLHTEEVEYIDNDGEIARSDNGLPGEATLVADSNKTYESNKANSMEENLRDSKDVDVAEDRVGLDFPTLEEQSSDETRDDLAAGYGTIACAPNSDPAFPETNVEDQRRINDAVDTPEVQVYNSVMVFKEADNLCNVEKDADLHPPDSMKGKYCQSVLDCQTFPVQENRSTTDGENCHSKVDKIQISQDANMNIPPVSWNGSHIISSEECAGEKEKQASTIKGSFEAGTTEQSKHALHQNMEEPLLGAKTKHYVKDENAFTGKIGGPILCRRTSLREITNFDEKEHTEDMSKGGKFLMPERVLRLTRSCSVPKQLRRSRSKFVMEDKNEVRMFNPRRPKFLPINPDPEREKVNLRHQMMDERKNAEEWMLDYALRKAVSRLAPSQRKKVTLLVAAFEAIMPPSMGEARINHAAISSTCTLPLQACH
ncbi:unnamed protein product [Victoria cruziana]